MKKNTNTHRNTDSIKGAEQSKTNSRISPKTRKLFIRLMVIPVSLILFFVYNSLMAKTPIKKISSHVYQIELGAVNCFIVEDSTGLTLVDTGYEGDEVKIFKALQSISKRPSDIKQIVLTHLHADHAGSAAAIAKQLNIPVFASTPDGGLLRAGRSARGKFDKHNVSSGLINKILFSLFIKDIERISPIENIQFVTDQQLLSGGVRVFYTAGHTAGHIAVMSTQDKVLMVGDAFANNLGLSFSIVYENKEEGKQTIQSTIGAIDFNMLCFGHGKPLTKEVREKFNDFVN